MMVNCQQLNPNSCLTYLLSVEGCQEVLLIDPVLEHVQDYKKLIDENNWKLAYVFDTHTHSDHISGGPALKDITGCRYAMHVNSPNKSVDFRISDSLRLYLFNNEVSVKILSTPGHSSDSVSLVFPEFIIIGDALFLDKAGAGRDDFPEGNLELHWESLQKINRLSEDLIVYPAHDYQNHQPSSLKEQKERNPYLKERTLEEYIEFVQNFKFEYPSSLKANYACAKNPKALWMPLDIPSYKSEEAMKSNINSLQVSLIHVKELKKVQDEKKSILLLDVREEDELKGPLGFIKESTHIPLGSLILRAKEIDNYKTSHIVTICKSGARSTVAAQILYKLGFSKVQALAGGMISWNKEKNL